MLFRSDPADARGRGPQAPGPLTAVSPNRRAAQASTNRPARARLPIRGVDPRRASARWSTNWAREPDEQSSGAVVSTSVARGAENSPPGTSVHPVFPGAVKCTEYGCTPVTIIDLTEPWDPVAQTHTNLWPHLRPRHTSRTVRASTGRNPGTRSRNHAAQSRSELEPLSRLQPGTEASKGQNRTLLPSWRNTKPRDSG